MKPTPQSKPVAPDINSLLYYARVVEAGSFSAAARILEIPKSRLSRQVADLERRLGVQLLHRTTRHLSMTETGKRYYEHCAALAGHAEAAQDVINSVTSEPSGLLRVVATPTFTQMRLAPLIGKFLFKYPQIKLELEVSNGDVDLLKDGRDIAIRVTLADLPDSNFVARKLGVCRRYLIASPSVIEKYGVPTSPADIENLPMITTDCEPFFWHLRKTDGTEHEIELTRARLSTGDLLTAKCAAVAGLGFALLSVDVCREELATGKLVRLLPEWEGRAGVIHAFHLPRRNLLPSVKCFLDFLIDELAEICQQASLDNQLPVLMSGLLSTPHSSDELEVSENTMGESSSKESVFA